MKQQLIDIALSCFPEHMHMDIIESENWQEFFDRAVRQLSEGEPHGE